ncbi:MAG: Rnase Y domain-containing protein, partial [Planctomycetota bacterium]
MNAIMMTIGLPDVLVPIVTLILGICLAAIVNQIISRAKSKTFEQDLQRQIEGAKREAENIIRSAQIDAAAETIKKKEQFTTEANQIRTELREGEMRLSKREDTLDRQAELLQQREKTFRQREKEVDKRLHNIGLKEKQLSVLLAKQKNQLLKITAMNIKEAKDLLLKRLEDECEHEMSAVIQRKVEETTETADE